MEREVEDIEDVSSLERRNLMRWYLYYEKGS